MPREISAQQLPCTPTSSMSCTSSSSVHFSLRMSGFTCMSCKGALCPHGCAEVSAAGSRRRAPHASRHEYRHGQQGCTACSMQALPERHCGSPHPVAPALCALLTRPPRDVLRDAGPPARTLRRSATCVLQDIADRLDLLHDHYGLGAASSRKPPILSAADAAGNQRTPVSQLGLPLGERLVLGRLPRSGAHRTAVDHRRHRHGRSDCGRCTSGLCTTWRLARCNRPLYMHS